MSNQQPYWANDNDTRVIPTSARPASQRGGQQSTAQGASPRGTDKTPTLLAGRFDATRTTVNLAVLAGLAGVITFAVLLVVDQALGGFTGHTPEAINKLVMWAIITGGIGIGVGLLYIPVVGTGNEDLFGAAIIALAIAATAVWVLFGGLLDGDWSTLTVLAMIVCTATASYSAPSRIEAARVR